ncbi:flagellar biosynthesis protein FlgA [Pikeienuella sp. HZG-20]|uniref:flagellar biosynthesis protein FlgA n=1 Tax=Paludibacillus litoralis TaxID=3133267 RepID=UPI0030ECF354
MHLDTLLGPVGARRIEAALIGAGEFGRSFISQMRLAPGMDVRVVCDVDIERAIQAFAAAGVHGVKVCETVSAARAAFEAGDALVIPDAAIAVELPVDVIVEATGIPEAAAVIAELGLSGGKHVVMVTKEAESVVGPLLAHRARAAGLVYTPADGDQPSLLIGLVAWCRLLGLEIVAAGKASEYDFVYDPAAGEISAHGRTLAAPDFAELWRAEGRGAARIVDARSELLRDFWRRTTPDLCEMTIVANATGLPPGRPALHAPVARALELPDVFAPVAAGGLLDEPGILDIFNCLRRPDEMSFAGGVFVVANAPDPATGRLFREKGIPASADGERFLISNIVHLLGAEAPMSILSACRSGKSTAGENVRPRIDLSARTQAPIEAGALFELGWRHEVNGLTAEMTPAQPLGANNAVPLYLLPGARARVDIPEGVTVTGAMVEPPAGSALWKMRAEQDALFAG